MADTKHTTLQDLLNQKGRIRLESEASGHDGFMPVAVRVPTEDGKTVTRGQVPPASPDNKVGRGRILVFGPTKERVTVLREKVGKSYNGDWLHEVSTREGHNFLALEKQLRIL